MITTRVFALLAAALVVSGCGTQAMPGTARTASGFDALRRTSPVAPAAAKAIAFEHLVVNDISALRDGGTIIAKGYVTRSTYVTIKFDGGLSSKTRGQLFVATNDFMQPEGTLRQALQEELAPLAKALKDNVSRAGAKIDTAALTRLADIVAKLDAEPAAGESKVTSLVVEKLPVRCPCFELKATFDGKPLAIRFEGMPGGYTIQSVELGGRQLTGADRAPIAAALKAAAPDAGARAGMVEDVADALTAS